MYIITDGPGWSQFEVLPSINFRFVFEVQKSTGDNLVISCNKFITQLKIQMIRSWTFVELLMIRALI